MAILTVCLCSLALLAIVIYGRYEGRINAAARKVRTAKNQAKAKVASAAAAVKGSLRINGIAVKKPVTVTAPVVMTVTYHRVGHVPMTGIKVRATKVTVPARTVWVAPVLNTAKPVQAPTSEPILVRPSHIPTMGGLRIRPLV